ncbi:hypothetical protein RIF29_28120 [Crotalaria pallida]|uniref:Uncharacterized protein n=1 Tax=Crotalaria pallida TaxID=3830 RepID=A0AAN9ESJ1_CROPI
MRLTESRGAVQVEADASVVAPGAVLVEASALGRDPVCAGDVGACASGAREEGEIAPDASVAGARVVPGAFLVSAGGTFDSGASRPGATGPGASGAGAFETGAGASGAGARASRADARGEKYPSVWDRFDITKLRNAGEKLKFY